MKYKFAIDGISCASCIEKITTLFNDKLNIHNLQFSNDQSQIDFESNLEINIIDINKLLKTIGNYSISLDNNSVLLEKNSDLGSSYKPIYILFSYLIFFNIILITKNSWSDFMGNFMASFFIVFSFFKMLDLKGFTEGYSSYDIIAKNFYVYGYTYPFIELIFGIGYILSPANLYLNIIVFIIMSISTIGVIKAKLSNKRFYCACVGTFLKVPLGSIAIIEGSTMVVMSLINIILIFKSF